MKGNSKNHSQLKDEILPFIFALLANTKISSLDISGHYCGNSLGLALGWYFNFNFLIFIF